MKVLHRRANAPGPWHNWSGSAWCVPARRVLARDEADIVEAVRCAADRGLTLRVAGAGHSFNPIVTTDGLLLDLSGYTGIVSLDREAETVTVRAGTRLRALNLELHRSGLALSNMGTLDELTIAGAVSTGSHGSGLSHPAIAGQLVALRLITADGTVHTCSATEYPELFRAAGTSLGALGVISTLTLRCVPSFRLRVVEGGEPLDAILEDLPRWAAGSEHATFALKAWSDTAATLRLDRTDAPASPDATRRRLASTIGEVRCTLAGMAGRIDRRAVRAVMTAGAGGAPTAWVDAGYNAFTFPQPVKLLSLEYALPLASAAPTIREAHEQVKRFGLQTPYSLITRFAAGDDFFLSPAQGRPTAFVNITVPRTVAYTELLRVFEAVLREHGGRPHWGKAHTATAETVAGRYPDWARFQAVRAKHDPDGLFTSDYLRRVLGPGGTHA